MTTTLTTRFFCPSSPPLNFWIRLWLRARYVKRTDRNNCIIFARRLAWTLWNASTDFWAASTRWSSSTKSFRSSPTFSAPTPTSSWRFSVIVHSFIHLLLHHEGSAVKKNTTEIITIKNKAKKKKTEKTARAVMHKSATVRSCYHSHIAHRLYHKTMLRAKVCQIAALMSVTDCFQDITAYKLPRAMKRYFTNRDRVYKKH